MHFHLKNITRKPTCSWLVARSVPKCRYHRSINLVSSTLLRIRGYCTGTIHDKKKFCDFATTMIQSYVCWMQLASLFRAYRNVKVCMFTYVRKYLFEELECVKIYVPVRLNEDLKPSWKTCCSNWYTRAAFQAEQNDECVFINCFVSQLAQLPFPNNYQWRMGQSPCGRARKERAPCMCRVTSRLFVVCSRSVLTDHQKYCSNISCLL